MPKKGGAAIASGGYGCVFSPPLPCEKGSISKMTHFKGKTVSKLMDKYDAEEEVNSVKNVYKALKTLPRLNDYFLFPVEMCKPEYATESDLEGFSNKCRKFYNNSRIAPNNRGDFPSSARIINMPHGGFELHKLLKEYRGSGSLAAYMFLAIANLIQKAIVPMNKRGVYHCDLKGENMMVDGFGNIRIIDWGLGGVFKKTARNKIPDFIEDRPFQFNLPFSCLIFNDRLKTNKCYSDKTYTLEGSPEWMIPELVKSYLDNLKLGDQSHYNYSRQNIAPILFSCDYLAKKDDIFTYTVNSYLVKAISSFTTFTKGEYKFDKESYCENVYLKNVDIWGALITLLPYLENDAPALEDSEKAALRMVLVKYLYSSTFAAKAIPIPELVSDLQYMAMLLINRKGPLYIRSQLQSWGPSFTHLYNSLVPLKDHLEVIKPHTPSPEAPKTKAPKAKATRTKTKAKRESKGKTSKPNSETRKRCPNGTRRNKKTGECEPVKK